jgi:hypothetical protein
MCHGTSVTDPDGLLRGLACCLSIVRGDLHKTNLRDERHMSGVGYRARKPSALMGTGNSHPVITQTGKRPPSIETVIAFHNLAHE